MRLPDASFFFLLLAPFFFWRAMIASSPGCRRPPVVALAIRAKPALIHGVSSKVMAGLCAQAFVAAKFSTPASGGAPRTLAPAAVVLEADRGLGVGGSLRLNFLDHVWRPAWQQCEREDGDHGGSHAAHDLLPAWQIEQSDEKKRVENTGNDQPSADGDETELLDEYLPGHPCAGGRAR